MKVDELMADLARDLGLGPDGAEAVRRIGRRLFGEAPQPPRSPDFILETMPTIEVRKATDADPFNQHWELWIGGKVAAGGLTRHFADILRDNISSALKLSMVPHKCMTLDYMLGEGFSGMLALFEEEYASIYGKRIATGYARRLLLAVFALRPDAEPAPVYDAERGRANAAAVMAIKSKDDEALRVAIKEFIGNSKADPAEHMLAQCIFSAGWGKAIDYVRGGIT